MTITRGQRVLGAFINGITFGGLFIGNLILLLKSGKTVGGLVAGYKYDESGMALIKLWFTKMGAAILYGITFSIFYWYDIITMEKRDGTMAEEWAGIKKIAN